MCLIIKEKKVKLIFSFLIRHLILFCSLPQLITFYTYYDLNDYFGIFFLLFLLLLFHKTILV